MSIYDYEYVSIEGRPVRMSDYKDKVTMIVNTASKCGFTYSTAAWKNSIRNT